MAAGEPATSVAAESVFAPIAASVAGGAALPVAFSRHWPFVGSTAGVPAPAFAVVAAAAGSVAESTFPAAAGTSGPALDFQWLEQKGERAEDRSDALHWQGEKGCSGRGN